MSTKRALREIVEGLSKRIEFLQAQVGQLQHRVSELEAGNRLDIPEMTVSDDGHNTVMYQFPTLGQDHSTATIPWKPDQG